MAQPALDRLDIEILRMLEQAPRWRRSLSAAAGRVDRLIRIKMAAACLPPGGAGRNMVTITRTGVKALREVDAVRNTRVPV